MSRTPPHLQERDGVWHFRMVVPKELRAALGKREIKRSLKTRDQKDARKLLPLEMLKARAALDEARRKLVAAEPSPVPAASLAEDELWGLMSRWFVKAQQQDSRLTFADIDPRALDEELTYVLDWDHAEPSTRQAARKLLDEQGIKRLLGDRRSNSHCGKLVRDAIRNTHVPSGDRDRKMKGPTYKSGALYIRRA